MSRIYDALQRRNQLHVQPRPVQLPARAPRPYLGVRTLPREQILSLYFTIEKHLAEDRPRIVLLTSTDRGEGTSTVARDLAMVVADAFDKPVLLVNVGGQKANTVGLEAVANGTARLSDVVNSFDNTPLRQADLLATGENASLLFDRKGLSAVLDEALDGAGLMVIDAPPISTDVAAATLARHAGGTVLVVEAERARAPAVDQARRMIEEAGGQLIGVAMNKCRRHVPKWFYNWI